MGPEPLGGLLVGRAFWYKKLDGWHKFAPLCPSCPPKALCPTISLTSNQIASWVSCLRPNTTRPYYLVLSTINISAKASHLSNTGGRVFLVLSTGHMRMNLTVIFYTIILLRVADTRWFLPRCLVPSSWWHSSSDNGQDSPVMDKCAIGLTQRQ